MFISRLGIILGLFACSACAVTEPVTSAADRTFNPRPRIQPTQDDARQFAELYAGRIGDKQSVLAYLAHVAGVEVAGDSKVPNDVGPEEWQRIVEAGFVLADRECRSYLQSLYWVNRDKVRTLKAFSLLTTTTSAIMGTAESSAKELAITTALLGFGSGFLENRYNTYLYELEPSRLLGLVEKHHNAYRKTFYGNQDTAAGTDRRVSNRSEAITVLEGYFSICLPTNIENAVNEAVGVAEVEAATGTATDGGKAIATKTVSLADQVSKGLQTDARGELKTEIDRLKSERERLKGQVEALKSVVGPGDN